MVCDEGTALGLPQGTVIGRIDRRERIFFRRKKLLIKILFKSQFNISYELLQLF